MLKLFITATDTDAGKTYVARLLTYALVKQRKKVAVYKPISAGCTYIDNELINEDARLLLAQSNTQNDIKTVNPIAFEPAIAPHIAANIAGQPIDFSVIEQGFNQLIDSKADIVITEGAGGWRLPLGNGKYLSEFAQQTDQQVILVVNMKLGCLNHAVLTYQSILTDGLTCIGWIANCQEDMPYLSENIAELKKLLDAPMLASLTYETDINKAAHQLNLNKISELATEFIL